MFSTISILFLSTLLYEAFVVAYTVAVSSRKKYLAAALSALMEPIKYLSLFVVVETSNKIAGIIAISLACALSNIIIISMMDKMKEISK